MWYLYGICYNVLCAIGFTCNLCILCVCSVVIKNCFSYSKLVCFFDEGCILYICCEDYSLLLADKSSFFGHLIKGPIHKEVQNN